MKFFAANFAALEKKDPVLASALLNTHQPDHCPLTVEAAKSGAPTLKISDKYLHSGFDPVKEADKITAAHSFQAQDLCLIYGFGLGYYIRALLKYNSALAIIVIEPDAAVLKTAMLTADLSDILDKPNLHLFCGRTPEQLKPLLEQNKTGSIKIIKLRSYLDFHPEYFTQIDWLIQSHLTQQEINNNTLRRFSKTWVRNLFRNIPIIARSPGLNQLENLLNGIPALLLASGPTLEEILPLLNELRQHCVLFAVDTSCRILSKYKIDPDFVIIVDPQYWNTRHLDWINVPNAIVISESSTHPRVFKVMGNPVFLGSSFFPLGQFFESCVGVKGKIGAGGSVATSAWDCARLLGCGPIYLSGLDLGFPDKLTHFKGATFEDFFLSISTKSASLESMSYRYLHEASPFLTESYTPTNVLTDKKLIIYKWWFESQSVLHPQTRTYTLSQRGVRIKGIEFRPYSEILKFPPQRQYIDTVTERIKSIYHEYAEEGQDNLKRIFSALGELSAGCSELKTLSETALREIVKIRGKLSNQKSAKTALLSLSEIEATILRKKANPIISFLLNPVINRISAEIDRTPGMQLIDNIDLSASLYHAVIDSADYHLKLLSELKILL